MFQSDSHSARTRATSTGEILVAGELVVQRHVEGERDDEDPAGVEQEAGGLFATMIERNAAEANSRVKAALEGSARPRETLTAFAEGLLTLLLSERALALNRAAISSPELAEVLLRHGRHTTGPLVEEYLARLADSGELAIADPDDAFRLLYGLVVQDSQIRALLGERPLTRAAIRSRARQAVDRFLQLSARPRGCDG
jgi:AcrR family transcriptional regulator